MQKPAGMRLLLAIVTLTKNPETAAGGILDPVIVARSGFAGSSMPPFGFDALRAFGACDVMQNSTPAEAHWRSIWDFSKSFDRLRVLEQLKWSPWRFARLKRRRTIF